MNNLKTIREWVVGAKGRMNYWLLLERMVIYIGQRDHIWCVVCVEKDSQHKLGMSTIKKLIIVVAEQRQNSTYRNYLYFALAYLQLYVR